MSEPPDERARVGVRELRQNLSVYLDRVKAGESLEVTEHGHPVAQLVPLARQPMSTLELLVAAGRIVSGTGDLVEYLKKHPPSPLGDDDGPPATDLLRPVREEERR
jgi:prevent-host-death family protein